MTASIRGFSGKAKSTPSRRHRPIRQDAIGGQACNGLCAWGRSEAGRTPEQPVGAACASKPQGSRRFVVETALPPFFFIFPRAQPRAFAFATVGVLGVPHVLRRMRLRFAAAASVETHRSPTIQYSAAGAPFRIPLSGAVLRRRPMRASFRFHGPMGVIRQAARRNSNDELIDPRMFRPSPPAFRSGGAEKSDSVQTLAKPCPHLNQPCGSAPRRR